MDQLMSLSRMARQVGVPPKWLREQVDAGQIPGLKVGRRYLFNPLAVREALSTMATRKEVVDGK